MNTEINVRTCLVKSWEEKKVVFRVLTQREMDYIFALFIFKEHVNAFEIKNSLKLTERIF